MLIRGPAIGRHLLSYFVRGNAPLNQPRAIIEGEEYEIVMRNRYIFIRRRVGTEISDPPDGLSTHLSARPT